MMRPLRNRIAGSSLRALRHGCPFRSWGDAMRRRWWRAKIDAAKAKGAVVIFRQSGGQIAEAIPAMPLEQFLDDFEALPDIAPLLPAARCDVADDIAAGRITMIGIDGGGRDDLAGITYLESLKVPQGEVTRFFGIPSIEGSSE